MNGSKGYYCSSDDKGYETSERVCSKKYDLNTLPSCDDGDSFACDDEEMV